MRPNCLEFLWLTLLQNKELEASEERKRKAKQLELQRKEAARNSRGMAPRAPSYPVYTPPSRPSVPDTYDTYEAEKKKLSTKYVFMQCPRLFSYC